MWQFCTWSGKQGSSSTFSLPQILDWKFQPNIQNPGSRIQDPGSRISIRIQDLNQDPGRRDCSRRAPPSPSSRPRLVSEPGKMPTATAGKNWGHFFKCCIFCEDLALCHIYVVRIICEHNRHNRMYHISSNKKGCHRLNSTKDFRQAWALGTSTWPRSKNDHQAHHHTQSNPKMSLFHLQSRRVWGLVIRSWRGAASYSGCKEKQQCFES